MKEAKRKGPEGITSTVNLLIMGLLIDSPLSAYHIAQIVETQIIGELLKISSPAVYKNIKELHKAGFLEMEKTRSGEMPEKKVYSVTKKGKAYFLRLMNHFSSHLSNHYFDFNTFLTNIDKVDRRTGLKMLENLRDQFYQMKEWIVNHEKQAKDNNIYFAGRAIIKQYRMILYTLLAWIEEVIEEYRETKDLGSYPK
jgi:DNA-binding PadR family transcriptional regulator